MYEKVRGVKRHGGVALGSRGYYTAKRAVRINNLKRSFWTSAAAVVTVICLLLVSPSGAREPEPTEPTERIVVPVNVEIPSTEPLTEPATEPVTEPVTEVTEPPTEPPETEPPFEAPTLTITGAALNGSDVTPLTYSYSVELNSAERLRVTAAITDQNGASLGSDGPYESTSSGTSPEYSAALRWRERPDTVTLTLTGAYTEDGEEKTVTASQTLNVPEEPFLAPTLTITEAALNGSDVTPLSYRYRVTLNSAESLRVTAAITDQNGANLGSGGPFSHTGSGTSPTRSAALRWNTRPSSVRLTLTGTYTENGETKTITATQTLRVAEEPFTAPTLSIVSASLNGTDVTPLSYSYRVTLNSAESMSVRAAITDQNGASLGSGGPFSHTGSGTSPTRSAALSWTTRPTSVTLTLTGTYTEKGQTKTLTARQTLTVAEEPFVSPTLRIVSAGLNERFGTPLNYSYNVTLNSAESMSVRAAIVANTGESVGSGGPYTHTSSGTSPTYSADLAWSTRPTSVTLTLTGTYTENGSSKTVTASQTLTVPEEPFTAPTLRIASAALNGTDLTPLSYSYTVTLNSAESMRVSAAITDQDGLSLGSDGPYEHSASGTSPTRSAEFDWTTRPTSVTLTLTGTYTEKGTTKTVTATQTLTAPEEPFTAPTLTIESGRVLLWQYMFLYNYSVDLKSASELTVEARFTYEDDDGYGTVVTYEVAADGPYTHGSSLTTELILVEAEEFPDELPVTLTLTGTYTDRDGAEQTITVTKELDYWMPPDIWVSYAERDGTDPDLIRWEGELTLNDADSVELYVTIGTEDADYASEGPFPYDADETVTRSIRADGHAYEELLLTVTCKYQVEGTELETEGYQFVNPQAFEAPTLTIDDAALNGTDVTPLSCSYTVALNSAQSLKVTAAVTADGLALGSGGPWNHTASGTSPTRSIDLAWTTRPETLTLTLTGTYEDQNGAAQTVTAARTLDVPEAPFVAPTLAFSGPCRVFTWEAIAYYAYTVDLNDATEMTVEAWFFCPDEYGGYDHTDGPYTHSASGTTDRITVSLEDEANLAETTLTLIGRYKDNHGVEQEIRVARELDVFNCPHFWILSAERDSTDPELIVYDIQIKLGSLDALTVNFSLDGGVNFATDTDTFTTDGIINGRTLLAAGSTWTDLVLTADWSYELDGDTWEDYYPAYIPGLTFTPPTLTIDDAALNGSDLTPLSCSYTVDLNSAQSLKVTAAVTADGLALGSGGPWNHTSSGSSPTRSIDLAWTTRPETLTLTLTGSYEDQNGNNQTVTATRTLTAPEIPFEAPTLTIESGRALVNQPMFLYNYSVDLKSASDLTVQPRFTYEDDDGFGTVETYQVAADGPYTHDSSLTTELIQVEVMEYPEGLPITLTLTGTYIDKNGAEQTITAAKVLENYTPPKIWISYAERDYSDPDLIHWEGDLWLNDADSVEIYAAIGTASADYGSEGPVQYDADATLSGTIRADGHTYEELLLTVTGKYQLEGTTLEVEGERYVDAKTFTAPTLAIESARVFVLDESFVYSYTVTLNDAESMDVSALFSYEGLDDDGVYTVDVATDGPYHHSASGTTDKLTVYVAGYPGEHDLELTLTGTYLDADGVEQKIEAVCDVPEFRPPEITITSAKRNAANPNEIVYSAEIFMRSAEALTVTVNASADDVSFATDGPFTFTADAELTDQTLLALDSVSTDLVLTLTGSYELDGETFEISDSAEVPAYHPFVAPTLTIDSARLLMMEETFVYSYTVALNDAASMDVTALFEYEELGSDEWFTVNSSTDGPYNHTVSGSTGNIVFTPPEPVGEYRVELTLTGTYLDADGVEQKIEAVCDVPEFRPPEITITSAKRNAANPNEIVYSAEIFMRSAEALTVTVNASADDVSFATDGPFTFTADAELTDQTLLAPDSVSTDLLLTLTGTYELDGDTFEISDSRDVWAVSSDPPSLIIDSFEVMEDYDAKFSYRVRLNAAESIEVNASLICEEEVGGSTVTTVIGTGGPYTHTESEPSRDNWVWLDEYPTELPVTLILTGTYLDADGVTRQIEARSTAGGFIEPGITLISAERDDTDPETIRYNAEIRVGSVEEMEVMVEVEATEAPFVSQGPYTFTEDDTLDGSIQVPGSAYNYAMLTVKGTYEWKGSTYTIKDFTYIEPLTFEWPELLFDTAQLIPAEQKARYGYTVNLFDVDSVTVNASFYAVVDNDWDNKDLIGTDGPYTHNESGSCGPFEAPLEEFPPGCEVWVILTVAFEDQYGSVVEDEYYRKLESQETPFTAPAVSGLTAVVNDFDQWADATLTYSYSVDLGSAESLRVKPSIVTGGGMAGSADLPEKSFTSGDAFSADVDLTLAAGDSSVTLTLTCSYDRNGVEYQFTKSIEALVSKGPDSVLEYSLECGREADDSVSAYLSVVFPVAADDPFAARYSFDISKLVFSWYDDGGNKISDVTMTNSAALSSDYSADDRMYFLMVEATLPPADNGAGLSAKLVLREKSTGKTYSIQTPVAEVA